jgi:hypothetical protein
MSGSERVKEHGGHGVENEVLQQAENENGFFRQEDRIGAERRKTAAGSPKGERSESIYRSRWESI